MEDTGSQDSSQKTKGKRRVNRASPLRATPDRAARQFNITRITRVLEITIGSSGERGYPPLECAKVAQVQHVERDIAKEMATRA